MGGAQAATARTFLDGLPERDALRARCEELFNHPRVGIPRRIGEKVFDPQRRAPKPERDLRQGLGGGRGARSSIPTP